MLVLLLDRLSLSLSLSLSSLSLPLMSNLVQVTQTTVVSHASTWKNISLLCCLRYLYCLCCVPLLSVSLPLSLSVPLPLSPSLRSPLSALHCPLPVFGNTRHHRRRWIPLLRAHLPPSLTDCATARVRASSANSIPAPFLRACFAQFRARPQRQHDAVCLRRAAPFRVGSFAGKRRF